MKLEENVKNIITECRNITEVIKKLNLIDNGSNYKKIRVVISDNNLDISHFVKSTRVYESKYKKIKRECPKCETEYETLDGGKEHRKFCSTKCANSKNWTEEDKKKKRISALNSEKVKNANLEQLNKKKLNKKKKNSLKNKTSKCRTCNIEYCNLIGKSIFCSDKCKSNWWSNHHKKLYETGRNYIAGGTTKWLPYKNIKVQGTYELRTCYILDKMLEVGDIKSWTYTKDRIPYIGIDGKTHTYLLDFKIENDNSFYYVETKGWKKDNDDFKWIAVKEYGYELKVWYLRDIKLMEEKYK